MIEGGYQVTAGGSGELLTVELRGEVAYFWPTDDAAGDPRLTGVLGLGRRFESSWYVHAEHLFNPGRPENLVDGMLMTAHRQLLQASQNVTGVVISYELLPILVGSAATLFEWDHHSVLLQPGLTLSAADEVDLLLGALFAVGDRPGVDSTGAVQLDSEFGTYSNYFYLESKIYF